MYTRQFGNIRQVATPAGTAKHHIHLMGPHPIINHFLERIGFARIVESCLPMAPQSRMRHSQALSVLIQNILLSPAPLYRIAEWAQPIDAKALGLSTKEKLLLNDDRIARSLDALRTPEGRGIFLLIALHVIKQFELDTGRIHHDTTTVTFFGQYKTSHKAPRITQGFNKDHRPDLKQLVFGLNVTSDGAVPISHNVFSGNRTDDTVHCGMVSRLRRILNRTDFVYVADSKLCTRKNLAHVAQYDGKFVTVLPRTRSEVRDFLENLRQGQAKPWYKLFELENHRRQHGDLNTYHSTSQGPQQTSEGYRIIWLRSSQKKTLDACARNAALERAEAELVSLGQRINRGKLGRLRAIRSKVRGILKKRKVQGILDVEIPYTIRVQKRYARRGRPGKNDPAKVVRHRVYRIEFERNKDAMAAEARTDGVFPLVTNLEARKRSKKEVLQIYKYQPYIEKRHALLKSELEIAPVYLKRPERAVGLIDVAFLAMTVDALIERTIRRSMQREGIKELPILPEGRMTKTPTTARILEMFSNVAWFEFSREDETVKFPTDFSPLQQQLLRMLDTGIEIYN